MLYPIKCNPIVLDKVWGSEQWLLSGFQEHDSVVANGYLAGNTISELLETYMDELVGGNVYQLYGDRFPLLFKYIDAQEDLSIQVHPDDGYAAEMEEWGKTEAWYVMPGGDDASVILGFNHDTDIPSVENMIRQATLLDHLQVLQVKTGDVIFIPSGTVHALRKNTRVLEIQQSCDLTYRLFDYNRPDKDGKLRPLHLKEAMEVLDTEKVNNPILESTADINTANSLIQDIHFMTNLLYFDKTICRDYAALDSFVVYLCAEGSAHIECTDEEMDSIDLTTGEAALIPASLAEIRITPQGRCRLLETYCG